MHAMRGLLPLTFLLVAATLPLGACRQSPPAPPAGGEGGAAPPTAAAGAATPKAAAGAPSDLASRFPAGKNCTVEAVQAAVQPHTDLVTACYRAGLSRNPDLAGALKLKLVVSELGRAHAVQVVENGLGDTEVAACVQGVLETLAYAPSPPDKPCTIVYPFDFQATAQVREQLRGATP
jgi:hypothetical protein